MLTYWVCASSLRMPFAITCLPNLIPFDFSWNMSQELVATGKAEKLKGFELIKKVHLEPE